MAAQTLSKLASADAGRLGSALSAILLGLGLILAVGFAPVEEIHNAAHDTRHSAGFPCH